MSEICNEMSEIWCAKYAPTSFKKGDWLGNEEIRVNFEHKKKEDLINYIFAGPPGIGKTLAGEILAIQFGANSDTINMSLEGKVANIESKIIKFCEGQSVFGGGRKILIFSEADAISKAAQKALRVPMEDYAAKVVFICTCNYPAKIIDPIHSRSCTIHFKLASQEDLKIFARKIIQGEGIEITSTQIDDITRRARGKFRNVANLLQGWTTGDKCNYPIYEDLDEAIESTYKLLLKLDYDKIRKNFDDCLMAYDPTQLIINLTEYINESSIPKSMRIQATIDCSECASNLVLGVDPFLSFSSLAAKLVLSLYNLRKK
jgi:replication factor C small subunit